MARPLWFVEFLKSIFPLRFTLAKLTKFPVIGEMVDYVFFNGDDIIYLPKDEIIPINQHMENPGSVVLPSKVVEHFIKEANHRFIMNFCICREGNNCDNVSTELGCIFLGDAVLNINPQYGKLATKEEALEHAHLCREEGLVHMIGRNRLDSIWLGAYPQNKLFTICNCCSCCCLWKVVPHLNPSISNKISKLAGVHVEISELCTGCGLCADSICFVNAIQILNGRATISEACRGCGRCVEVCPIDAINLTFTDSDMVYSEVISRLSSLVDIT